MYQLVERSRDPVFTAPSLNARQSYKAKLHPLKWRHKGLSVTTAMSPFVACIGLVTMVEVKTLDSS
jgi:hypothetical protein